MEQNDLARLAGTLACDRKGRPLVFYHGTFASFDRFERTLDIGYHFGSHEQALRRRNGKVRDRPKGGEWRIMKVALSASKVAVFPDDPLSFTNWSAVSGLARLVDPDFLYRLKRAGVNDSAEAARLLRGRMLDLGYDAVVYRNMHEARVGSVADWSWLVLRPESVIILPDDFKEEALGQAVGCAPGLDLPRSARDIPAARNRNGDIRFLSDRRSLIGAIGGMAAEMGGELGPGSHPGYRDHENTYCFQLAFPDGEICCQMFPEIGRVSMVLPLSHRQVMAEAMDDFVSYAGLSSRTPSCLIYEWQEGEPLGDFVARLRNEIGRLRDLAEGLGMEPRAAAG